MTKFVGQIGLNILAQIRRQNRFEYTCPNPPAKSARIYLSNLLYHHDLEFGKIGWEGQYGRECYIGKEADRF